MCVRGLLCRRNPNITAIGGVTRYINENWLLFDCASRRDVMVLWRLWLVFPSQRVFLVFNERRRRPSPRRATVVSTFGCATATSRRYGGM
jgi:hypothetical protein